MDRIVQDKVLSEINNILCEILVRIRRGKKINMVLVLCVCARAGNSFFTANFYQLMNIDLSLKERVCEKYEIKSDLFVATLYYM